MKNKYLRKFSFPLKEDELSSLHLYDEKTCVISIIGKSCFNVHSSKAYWFNHLTECEVFEGPIHDYKNMSLSSATNIDGYHDVDRQVVYLHLLSGNDATYLCKLYEELSETDNANENMLWENMDQHYAKALLFIFSVSHMILVNHPGTSFDVSYVRLFKIIESIRLKLQPLMADVLQEFDIRREWCVQGRPCSPRVLFIFESNYLGQLPESDPNSVKSRSMKITPLKKLRYSMEDQIYRILRKARIITNISNNSLFAIPANQEFVFINSELTKRHDPISFFLADLRNNCMVNKEADISGKSYSTTRRTNLSGMSDSNFSDGSSSKILEMKTFEDFIWQHIDIALSKGFDDNVGRNPVPSHFEITTFDIWLKVASKCYDFFILGHSDVRTSSHFNSMSSLLQIDARFSESRCSKVLPLAKASYQENLPAHYTLEYHISKLAAAKRVLLHHARGTACDIYIKQLEKDCEHIWRDGRQLCEVVSLTGRHCCHELHRLEVDEVTDENKHLSILKHNSQFKTRAACNCGRKQSDRDDPFEIKDANILFYKKLERLCCNTLQNISLAQSIDKTENSTRSDSIRESQFSQSGPLSPSKLESSISVVDLSQPHSFGQFDEIPCENDDKNSLLGDMDSLDLEDKQSDPEECISGGEIVSLPDDSKSDEVVVSPNDDVEYIADNGNHSGDNGNHSGDNGNHSGGSAIMKVDEDFVTEEIVWNKEDINVNVVENSLSNEDDVFSLRSRHSTFDSNSTEEGKKTNHDHLDCWGLVSLGKYNCYSASQGLEMPGFFHGSHYLLPWDNLMKLNGNMWPSVNETSGKKSKAWRIQREQGEYNVRIYIGFEYECSRGHRFFCSSPDKMLKAGSSGLFKENAKLIVENDMPLYFPCHCRSSTNSLGQLMRIYVAIPEGPFKVTLAPKVIPGFGAPTFDFGFDSSIDLPVGQIWVLRLPFIYSSKEKNYASPSDLQELPNCKLLKDFLIVTSKEVMSPLVSPGAK